MNKDWKEGLKEWIDNQHGTAGWEQKLENYIQNTIIPMAEEAGYEKGMRDGMKKVYEEEEAWIELHKKAVIKLGEKNMTLKQLVEDEL